MVATLPIEYQRRFSIQVYWASHGLLLLRSHKSEQHSTRIDILFTDVRWMALPVWLDGVQIEHGKLLDIPIPLTAKIKEEAHFMTTFKLVSQGVTHFVLAGKNVLMAEDQNDYGQDSSLMPNHDFHAFVAPLWKNP